MFLLPAAAGYEASNSNAPRVVYSATDLAVAAASEFDFLRTLDMKLGRYPAAAAIEDPMFARTAELGDAHEHRLLEKFVDQHGDKVVSLGRPSFTEEGLVAARAETFAAIEDNAPVIYQGTFFDGSFAGFCDFLVREDTSDGAAYAVYDTKLSRHARVPALLQLAAYADQLISAGVAVSPVMHLVLGDGTITDHRLSDVLPVYRQRRARLDLILSGHLAQNAPVAWGDPRYSADVRSDLAADEITRTRDVILVAGLTTVQRARLERAGVRTLDELAALDPKTTVPGISPDALARLRAQAGAQVEEERTGQPHYVVHNPAALRELPQPSPGDIFFDFEGDPLWAEDGSTDWGLEYLFGIVEAPDARIDHDPGVHTTFRAFWAHNRAEEKRALHAFLEYVTERRARFPDMHVYHYAPYEKTALRRLVGRHGICEATLDTLLRANVFVDLYPLVRKAVRVGKPSYSIKKLEPLYMGEHLRGGDVTTAGDSIAEYARFTGLAESGAAEEAAGVLASIEDYNRYDCDSTLHLRNWLARCAQAESVPLANPVAEAAEDANGEFDTSPLEVQLLEYAGELPQMRRSGEQQTAAMFAAAMNYHWREDKPFWWGHFDRLSASVSDLAESSEAFLIEGCDVVSDWAMGPRQRVPRRVLRIAGEAPNGATLRAGGDVFALYDAPSPQSARQPVPGARGFTTAQLLSSTRCHELGLPVSDECIYLEEKCPKGAEPHSDAPVAITPGPPPSAQPLKDAIERIAESFADQWPQIPRTAAVDVLRRIPPRTLSGAGPVAPTAPNETAAAIIATLRDLDHSYLAVQGPPGTGKTYTGSKVIAELVLKHGWRVGVVAQSHSVVENMLDCIVEAHVPGSQVFKPDNRLGSSLWTTLGSRNAIAGALESCSGGAVVGGTAWTFANPNQVPAGSLDLLVIDEAGQFSLANTIAVSAAARNLMLLGDPQQLPQVSQGTHPEPVDESALGWLIGDHGTIPSEFGYFLERTFRMHPALCGVVSGLSYEGRLTSEESVTTARLLTGIPPGLRTITVPHTGNSTASGEEARAICAEIQKILGTPWRPKRGAERLLEQQDVIVVAPYNAQVNTILAELRMAGLNQVMAGTVDKFQGRQAAVAIVSMTASAIEDVPRGMSFLLNRNRLNVAISRGQWLAMIVRSPTLTEFMPTTPHGLEELGAFLTVCEAGELSR
ncbi:TM0106 family RecB-like putative nuclease [Hoyosella altamirensis]|uniref:Nuclease n=1 Tax=Hoyosella altamirensis TaxID=616997 RepID=A0A839RM81_9ACTN|nr:bifunctional RecB family nuclease/DEAD/DEAH box helicase [Hoyosella altamirensis]MBB3037186.1 uncharacterized protein [Hoyosella altamirensis]